MPLYLFKAKDASGENVEGSREAVSEKDLLVALRSAGLVVFSISGASSAQNKAVEVKARAIKKSGGRVKQQDIAIFCRQLSAFINAGISILDGIDDLSSMVSNAQFSRTLKAISADIRGGSNLSDSMRKYHKIFGRIFIAMVAVGEKTGKLGTVLSEMSTYLEHSVQLRRKVQAAAAYPVFIGVFFVVAMSAIVLFLVPKFKAMFSSFGATLPLPTKIAFAISDMALAHMPLVIFTVTVTVVGAVMMYRTPPGRMFIDTWQLRIPMLGDIIAKVLFARFFQTLATLLRSGVDLVVSLEIASRVMGNGHMETVIGSVRKSVIEGSTLADAFEKFPLFPRMVVRMSSVGEKTGSLSDMFVKLSGYYGDEVDGIVSSLSSLIEPLLIVLMGGVVGIFVFVMYLPIFKLAGAMMSGGY
ncbi:MAG: type II secretion system F family protein [Elusimicrobia bacterium]|nr:type II secretion system F family protein [Elusimicrobiota bacterium]